VMSYAEIGYGIAEHHQGKGIATDAVNQFVQKCFCESPLRKLLAYVHDKNAASCRVLEKAGFAREGTLREHYVINGVPENEILFGLLKHEWERNWRATGGLYGSIGASSATGSPRQSSPK
jgi:ribosomal-protein-alanine N-acetyltransferase